MKTINSVDWGTLLEESKEVRLIVRGWSEGVFTTRDAVGMLSNSRYAGAFRHLVRSNGSSYGRRLARKALKYRNV